MVLPVTEVAYAVYRLQKRAWFQWRKQGGIAEKFLSVPGKGTDFFYPKHFKPRGKDLKPEKYTKGERV